MNEELNDFQRGCNNLKNSKVALNPQGTVFMDGYMLLLVTTDGKILLTKKSPSNTNHETTYKTSMDQLKNINWNKRQKPNTPSVEMLLNLYFPNIQIKAYAMWAISNTGINASTIAVYEQLKEREITKICDTMEMCSNLYYSDNTFIMD